MFWGNGHHAYTSYRIFFVFPIVDLLCRLGRVVQGDVNQQKKTKKKRRVEENQIKTRKKKKPQKEHYFV